MTTESSIFDSKFFTPEFREWLMTADLEEIYGAVSDHFKEENGFRPNWRYGHTREEYAQYFISESERVVARQEWDEWNADPRNHPLSFVEPEPLPYEEYDVV